MSEQQHKSSHKQGGEQDAVETDDTEVTAEAKDKLDADVDSILDDIDDVLEENAEEFVRSFVQKGGQ